MPSNDAQTDAPVTAQAKAAAQAAPAEKAAPAAPEPEVSAEDFCRSSVVSDKRHELLYAFCRSEERGGRGWDTRTNYAARLKAFADQPVKG